MASKQWSCTTLDDGIKHVVADSKPGSSLEQEEAALLREIQARGP